MRRVFVPLAILAPLAGRLTSRIGPRWPIVVGLAIGAAFLLWGIGMGVLTPAVAAAAIGAVPGERAGLASAINNTARQAGGAIEIAVAGQPGGRLRRRLSCRRDRRRALYAVVAVLVPFTLRSG